jgi:DNA-binding transcriptional MocR family regulator
MAYTPAREDVSAPVLGAAQLASLLDDWSTAGKGPLARRLAHVMRSRISTGLLAAGTTLPPERSLAQAIGVSRSTVVAALDELRGEGFLASRQGSGTWVAVTGDAAGDGMNAAERLLLGAANINLAASVPEDASHLPDMSVDVADLASVTPAHGYAPAGLPQLRDAIADFHRGQGLDTTVEQVHVTNGAQHALDLALGAVTRPGDVVAVENPTYVGVFDVMAARGLRPLPLPLDAIDEDPDAVVKLCRAGRARAVFLVPSVHSPTGRVRRAQALHELAARLDTLRLPVIEDNTVADLAFRGTRGPSLARLCVRAPVIAVESTSKVGWGGLRVGWLRGPRATVEHTIGERGRTDFGSSIASQLFAVRLLDRYDELISARRVALASAANVFTQLLRRHLPDCRFERPRGGLSIWIDVGTDAEQLTSAAMRYGVTIAPGTTATPAVDGRSHVRLCFDRRPIEVQAALSRLGRAAEDLHGRR